MDEITPLPNMLIARIQERHRDDVKIVTVDTDTYLAEAAYLPMVVLYPMVRSFIAGMMVPNNDGNPEAQQMTKLMKTAVKGILIMYGEKLLTIMIGKDHDKPPKGCDLVEWYTNTFASIALTMASKRVYTVYQHKDEDDFSQIDRVSSISISES